MAAPRAPELDARLCAAMRLAGGCNICADIGADHGRLSAVMLLSGAAQRALVADISPKALEKARKRMRSLRLEGRATFAVADGLEALDVLPERRADVIFILGMGGDTIAGILRRGQSRLRGAALVLSAQTELPLLRSALCEVGYRLRREELALDGRRCYVLMRAEPAGEAEAPYTEEQTLLGPMLMLERPPLWKPLLQRRKALLQKGVDAMARAAQPKDAQRLALFKRELGYVSAALSACEGENAQSGDSRRFSEEEKGRVER